MIPRVVVDKHMAKYYMKHSSMDRFTKEYTDIDKTSPKAYQRVCVSDQLLIQDALPTGAMRHAARCAFADSFVGGQAAQN